jgi:hypothetical protein
LEELIFKHLKSYYSLVQPTCAAEWLGFDGNKLISMQSQPPWNILLPWENVDINQKKIHRMQCALDDNAEHGCRLGINNGWRNFGPVEGVIVQLEATRLINLYHSIEKSGYVRNDASGDIGAVVLFKDDGTWRWLVENGGQHRASVLSALGYKKIVVKVWQIVEERDAELWPSVISGLYTKAEALEIFNRIFEGEPPSVIEPWVKYVNDKEANT